MATPMLAMAQSADTNDVSLQVQNLVNQIEALKEHIKSLHAITVSSTTPHDNEGKPNWSQGSSTMPHDDMMGKPGAGDMMGGPGARAMNIRKGAMCAAFSRTLRQGSQGDDVRSLQGLLHDHDLIASSSITGFFGPKTAEALARFQEKFGIASSSASSTSPVFGPKTRGFLQSQCVQGMHNDMGEGSSGTTTRPDWGKEHGMMRPNDASSTNPTHMMMPRQCFSGPDGTGTSVPCPIPEHQGGGPNIY